MQDEFGLVLPVLPENREFLHLKVVLQAFGLAGPTGRFALSRLFNGVVIIEPMK